MQIFVTSTSFYIIKTIEENVSKTLQDLPDVKGIAKKTKDPIDCFYLFPNNYLNSQTDKWGRNVFFLRIFDYGRCSVFWSSKTWRFIRQKYPLFWGLLIFLGAQYSGYQNLENLWDRNVLFLRTFVFVWCSSKSWRFMKQKCPLSENFGLEDL